ncbi:MAG: glycosyltransferase family 4 protein [Anaerolinea sp.]|nr:glycosyltransferase family 4 protein [Anaerolinea sp.]
MPSLLFDARLILPKPTGIGQYISSLLPELWRQAPDWHIHLLRGPHPWPGYGVAQWQAPNLMHHISGERHMSLRQHWALPHLAQQLGVNLVHYPHFDAPVVYQPIPVVATLYDVKYLVRPDFFTNLSQLKRLYMRFCFANTLRRAAVVIAISQATAQDMARLFAVPTARLSVIHLAADAQFQPADVELMTAFRGKYGVQRPFLLTVGERRPHKNHLGLLQAYARSASRHTHDLVIIGQPYQDYTAPEEFAQVNELASQVHFLNSVTFPELIAAYTAADLFILVSFYEGFGLPVLEAMACDTPVIAANSTASGEVVGEGGLAVNPHDTDAIQVAMDNLLADAAERQAWAAKGRRWQQRFSWQQAAAETLALYHRVLG